MFTGVVEEERLKRWLRHCILTLVARARLLYTHSLFLSYCMSDWNKLHRLCQPRINQLRIRLALNYDVHKYTGMSAATYSREKSFYLPQ